MKQNNKKPNFKDQKQGRNGVQSNSKSKSNGRKNIKKESNPSDVSKPCRGNNDISWYAKNPEMVKSAGSIPFASIMGNQVFPESEDFYLRGIMKITYTPAFGGLLHNMYGLTPTTEDTSKKHFPIAINQAAKSMYSYLVHANSRNYNYEYQDLMMMIVAGTQVFCALGCMIRAYGTIKYYNQQAAYAPDGLVAAMGFDPDSLRSNLGQAWFDINNLIAQSQQIWIPNTFTQLQRWFWLNSNIFTDAESRLPATYVFSPSIFYMLNETAETTGTSIEPATYQDSSGNYQPFRLYTNPSANVHKLYQWSEWVSVVQHMLDRLVNSEDRGMIFGDILNAFGADKIFALAPIPSDYMVAPVFNAEVLTQIENITVTNAQVLGLSQSPKGLWVKWLNTNSMSHSIDMGINHALLNFHQMTQPTPEQVMVATRLQMAGVCSWQEAAYKWIVTSSTVKLTESSSPIESANTGKSPYSITYLPLACGSETINNISMMNKPVNANSSWTAMDVEMIADATGTSNGTKVPGLLVAFDWHPFIYTIQTDHIVTNGVNTSFKVLQAYGDYDNYTIMSPDMLDKLHSTALLSEWNIVNS